MDKHEQELRQRVADLKAKAEEFNNSGKYEDAKATIEEAKNAKNELDNYLAMEQIQVPEPVNSQTGALPPASIQNEDTSYKEVFMKAIRGKSLSHEEASVMQEYKAALSENTGKDGGYIVPEDITTTINQLKQTVDNLEQYVNVQPVSTNKGARTLEKRAASTPFAPLSEYGNPNAMQEIASPQFDRLPYVIEDYAGFLPVPNDLLNDTDQALEAYLRQWIAKKSIATRNYLILQEINKLTKVDLKDYKGIKTALNVTLDPAFSAVANIITNQDGFNYLDQLEDKDGRPLLQPDPTNPTRKLLSGKPVIVLSNKTIATDKDGKAPFIVGDLKEAVVLWDRQQLSLDMTKEGGSAWRGNTTEFRAIEREDVTLWDTEAVVYGQITVVPKTGA
ncbi:phage major capsid protein [Bacillus cereus]|uniref:phage major capsid protein n=1 Tax=Bacillus cereus group TaxID=86661 RepID=UPI0007F961EF|nr:MULTISPECIES: phage major capsid protein [Bacillus cereus group]ARV92727.1 major capsid protein [Bacillus thuringiensis]MDZ4569086.1 phage major capsid protein [Bacillus cereus]MDZ4637176.1 phage major capsid protein [Bacillus cereus]MEB9661286.1 phage major capsid protein [Bacillus cereus]OKP55760.1 major capsid protein [Bacillus cereus]